ncbi:hypothetical protein F0562_024369 [Nyssa sinensis]|uniref:Uncharacterized protein n=1 Tax=Nyssa sinensis TaxID=561372 RepID=A0A5J5BFU7_9ASTE|nr:hypothetical protein F0562_024369 [Nyssa sinensis]
MSYSHKLETFFAVPYDSEFEKFNWRVVNPNIYIYLYINYSIVFFLFCWKWRHRRSNQRRRELRLERRRKPKSLVPLVELIAGRGVSADFPGSRRRNLARFRQRGDRFVNKVRGSDFPEISLDDLAIEFFPSKDPLDERESERGRSSSRSSEISRSTTATMSSQRRGRSVSRQSSRVGDGNTAFSNGSGGVRVGSDANSRRRRSVSVVRCQISDSESHSSALTDDEGRDAHSSKKIIEKTIRAVYAQNRVEHPIGDDVNSGLYEAMRKRT